MLSPTRTRLALGRASLSLLGAPASFSLDQVVEQHFEAQNH